LHLHPVKLPPRAMTCPTAWSNSGAHSRYKALAASRRTPVRRAERAALTPRVVHPGEACASLVATARRMQRCREVPAPAGREVSSAAIESAVLNSSASGPALS
ncbi:hypothetical protein, partial [Streptomyces sp. NPDC056689]|uniref:hypothetical protein n=1 Tax=Streptomyces sp. NPDC056689 TaxID=3345911 RepID=UPI00369DE856